MSEAQSPPGSGPASRDSGPWGHGLLQAWTSRGWPRAARPWARALGWAPELVRPASCGALRFKGLELRGLHGFRASGSIGFRGWGCRV